MIVWWWLACAKQAPVGAAAETTAATKEPLWFEVEPGKVLCVTRVPEAEPLPKKEAQAFEGALAAVTAGDPGASALLAPLPVHPGVEHARAILSLLTGDPSGGPKLLALADQVPANTCLAATASLAAASTGDAETAERLLSHAREIAPDDGNVAFLSWYMGLERPAEVIPVLEASLAAEPDQPGIALAVGLDRLDRGDFSGIPLVEQAVAAGMKEGIGVLLFAYPLAHQRGPYLKLASEVGLLGDEGSIAGAEDPEAAYAALLGIPAEGPFGVTFETSAGDLKCVLRPDIAPVAVATFVQLARGTRPWLDPKDQTERTTPLYDGTIFHRVVPGFMIQGGDPLGTGSGGPGYRFPDEVDERLRFDAPGRLAMANAGPNTNGSQFFVTEAPASHLDGMHTIFGECDAAAVELVKKIASAPRDDDDRPLSPVVLEHVVIGTEP